MRILIAVLSCALSTSAGDWAQIAYLSGSSVPSAEETGDAVSFSTLGSKLSDVAINSLGFNILKFEPTGSYSNHPTTYFDFADLSFDSTASRSCTPYTTSEDEAFGGVWQHTASSNCLYNVCNFGRAHFGGNVWSAYGYKSYGGCGESGPIVGTAGVTRGEVKLFVYIINTTTTTTTTSTTSTTRIAPAISCPANIVTTAEFGTRVAKVDIGTPVATDLVDASLPVLMEGLASGSYFPLGTSTITFRTINSAGLEAECITTVTVTLGSPVYATGWYRGEGGQSCTQVCNATGLSCDAKQPATVISEQLFIAVNDAITQVHGTGFQCGSYHQLDYHHPGMPGMFLGSAECQYYQDSYNYTLCDTSHSNDERMCCCVTTNDDPTIACDATNPLMVYDTSSVGEDPMFTTVSGQQYEVTGEHGKVFNLLTSETLQINSEFRAVPQQFQKMGLTKTVLGDTACMVKGDSTDLLFVGANGTVLLNGERLSYGNHSTPNGIRLTYKRYTCSKVQQRSLLASAPQICKWAYELQANEVDIAFQKLVLEYTGFNIVFLTNFVQVTPPHVHRAFGEFIGMLLMQQANWTSSLNQMRFLQINVKRAPSSLALWHGLLGQHSHPHALNHSLLPRTLHVDAYGSDYMVEYPSTHPQGEGVIDGLYTDYQERKNQLFGCSFAYNMFSCPF